MAQHPKDHHEPHDDRVLHRRVTRTVETEEIFGPECVPEDDVDEEDEAPPPSAARKGKQPEGDEEDT